MELAEMIRQAEADLKAADANVDVTLADVDRAQTAHAAAKQEQANMQATLSWLRQQAERAEHAEQAKQARIVEHVHDVEHALVEEREERTVVQERFGKPVPEVKQSDLCLMALEHLGRPSTTTEVREYLQRQGYTYDQDQIRSALKYLGKKKPAPVESPRTSVWRLTRPDPPELPTATMTLNGAGRSP